MRNAPSGKCVSKQNYLFTAIKYVFLSISFLNAHHSRNVAILALISKFPWYGAEYKAKQKAA